MLENLGTVDAGAKIRVQDRQRRAVDAAGQLQRPHAARDQRHAGQRRRQQHPLPGRRHCSARRRPIVFQRTQLTASKLTLTLDGTGRERPHHARRQRAARRLRRLHGRGRARRRRAARDAGVRQPAARAPGCATCASRSRRPRTASASRPQGQSTLGPFDGLLDLTHARERADADRDRAARRVAHLGHRRADARRRRGVAATLALAGGGLDGTVALAPRGGGQGVRRQRSPPTTRRFGGATPLSIRQAKIDAQRHHSAASSLDRQRQRQRRRGSATARLFIGRFAGARRGHRRPRHVPGLARPAGAAPASRCSSPATSRPSGSRSRRAATTAGETIVMPRRAVLLKHAPTAAGQLQKTQLAFGGGFAIVEGRFGGGQPAQGRLSLAKHAAVAARRRRRRSRARRHGLRASSTSAPGPTACRPARRGSWSTT